MEADRGLVEDVGDVGERRAEVPDHLRALRLSAREGPGGAVEGEVTQADLGERVEDVLEAAEQRRDRWLVQAADPRGEVGDLHRAQLGDVLASDPRGPRLRRESGAVALRAGLEGDGPLDEGADVRLHRLPVLGQHRLLDPRDEPLEGEVDPLDLDLRGLAVEEVAQLALGVLPDRLVHVEPEAGEDAAVPALHRVPGDAQCTLAQRLRVVVERGEVEVADCPHPLAARAHPAEAVEGRLLGLRLVAPLDGDGAARAHRRDVEGERVGTADVRLTQTAEEDPQHRVRVGGRADGGSRVGTHPLLVDDDRRRQAVEEVHVGSRQVGHEALHEGAVGLIDQALGLRGDGVEHERALAGAGDTGEDGEAALRDGEADVLEVVLARPLHADQVVAVGDMRQ